MDIKRNGNRKVQGARCKVQGARCKVQGDVVPGSSGSYKNVALPGWNGYSTFRVSWPDV